MGAHPFRLFNMKPKWTQEELERELEHDRITDKELTNDDLWHYIQNVMGKIEDIRKERLAVLKKSNGLDNSKISYTQEALAKEAGISLSAYKSYLSSYSDNISLKTLLKISKILQCDLEEILKSARTGN